MMGLGVTDDQRLQALADSLRGRRQAADVFAMSTISPLAKAAQGEQRRVQATAEGIGALRRARMQEADRTAREYAIQQRREEEAARSREATAGIQTAREAEAQRERDFKERMKRLELGAKGDKPPTAAQQTARYRADTFEQGLSDMREILAEGYDPTSPGGLKDKITSRSDLLRWAASPEGEQWQSATNTVKEAALRTATGAAAPEGENRDYIMTLIPQPFESSETVEFKMRKLEEFGALLDELGGATEEEAAANFNMAAERLRASETESEKPPGLSDDEWTEYQELKAEFGN